MILIALLLIGDFSLSYAARVAERPRFDGKKVTIALHSGHFEIPWRARANRIKDLFGIDIEVVGIVVGDLFDKELIELSTGTGAFDLLMFNPAWYGDLVDFLRPLDDFIERWDPGWADIHPGFQVWENTYGGKRYSITMDGDVFLLYYRKDLFENPQEKAAFKQRYGYDLEPPQTWDQVLHIAEFFRRDTSGDGQPDMWGYADQAKRGRSFYWYLIRYFGFCGPYKNFKDPHLFDPDTLEPLINQPCAVQALENYKRAIDLAPTGILGWEWDELFNAFMKGQVAMIVHWPDEGKRSVELSQQVAGARMGFGLIPGATHDGRAYRRSSTGGGWVLGLAKDSKNPEAAYMVMWYMLGPEVSLSLVLDPGTGQDFYRLSHFESGVTKVIAPPDYLDAYNQNIAILYPEVRIPGAFNYYDALDRFVQEALAGRLSPKQALDQVAQEWNQITNRLGKQGQVEKYRKAFGL
jgi:multiple sugar transport system substrate-binding protein